VTREDLIGTALIAFPPDVRAARGPELGATALDLTDGAPRRAVARELAGLVRAGLDARAARGAGAGPLRLLADGLCLAAAWFLTVELATLLGQRVRGMHDPLLASWSIGVLAIALALVLVGFDRAGGLLALAWTAARTPAVLGDGVAALDAAVAALVPTLCFAVLVLLPRRRAADPRRLAWLAIPIALALICGPPRDQRNAALLLLAVLILLVVAVAGLVALPADPRLAVAGAVPMSAQVLQVLQRPHGVTLWGLVLLATGPAACAAALARARRVRRAGAGGVSG
jgi:hypothetical protein